ncbi:MAG TPA: MCE family protein [Candidatus Coprenecus merdipullorum]|nr:MCE family protein [Candidatus Coprenecus merdipullorum]
MRKEVRIGLFAAAVTAAAVFTVEFLKGKDIFSKTDTYYIIYPSVDGVDVSTAVTVGGYTAGRVSDVEYNPEAMNYTVSVSVSREFTFPDDSRMEVYSSDIMGTRKIRIAAGNSNTTAASGDTIRGVIEPDILSSLAGSIEPVAAGLDTLVRGLNRTVESVNLILDKNSRDRINSILGNMEAITEDLSLIAGTFRDKNPEIRQIITRLSSISARLDSAAVSAAGTLDNAEAVTASLRDARIGETVESIHSLVLKLQDPSGSLGRLIVSDSLYNSLTQLSNDLDSLVRKIEDDPKKYIKISVF